MKDTSAKRRQNRRWNAFNASRKRTPERIQQGQAHHEPQQRARAVEKTVVHERKGWEGGAPNLRPRRIADRRSTTAAAALSKRAIDGRLIQRALQRQEARHVRFEVRGRVAPVERGHHEGCGSKWHEREAHADGIGQLSRRGGSELDYRPEADVRVLPSGGSRGREVWKRAAVVNAPRRVAAPQPLAQPRHLRRVRIDWKQQTAKRRVSAVIG